VTHDLEILFYSDFPLGFHNPEAEEKMARFARRGYRVTYVEQLGIRNPGLRHLPRLLGSVRPRTRSQRRKAPFDVISPKLLWPRRAPLVDRVNRAWLRRQLLAGVNDASRTILWIRCATPELLELVEGTDWHAVVYELVDEHAQVSGLSPRLHRIRDSAEDRILARADVAFAWAEPIRGRLAAKHDNVVLAPPAVDLAIFADGAGGARRQARTACYAGSFDDRLDANLMVAAAGQLRDWTFVFAGRMTHSLTGELTALPNVRPIGPIPAEEVPGVLARAAVCVMPYRQDAWGQTLFPIKLVEYLAAGKPVVSTPIAAAVDFADVISLAGDPEAFAEAIVGAAERDSAEARARRLDRVRPFSWDRRIDQLERAVLKAAGGRRA
jgi:glycosyltransferase involved in cell wall biosynthesis